MAVIGAVAAAPNRDSAASFRDANRLLVPSIGAVDDPTDSSGKYDQTRQSNGGPNGTEHGQHRVIYRKL
jgi:hypothetical protein